MSRLTRLSVDELSADQLEVHRAITSGRRGSVLQGSDGALEGPFNAFLYVPQIGRALSDLGEAIRFETTLSDKRRELAILTVAVVRRSGFEWYVHAPLALESGLTESDLDLLLDERWDSLDPDESTVAHLCVTFARGERVSDVVFTSAVEAFGITAVLELVFLVGYYTTLASVMDVVDVGSP